MLDSSAIPIIDLSPIWSDEQHGIHKVAEELRDVYMNVGFSYIVGHQVPEKVIQNAFAVAELFHSLPIEQKMAIKQNNCFRGYVPMSASQLRVSTEGVAKKPNLLDAFVMAFDLPSEHPDYHEGRYLAGPNQWPEQFPELKEILGVYRDHLLSLAQKLVEVFSIAMGAESTELNAYFNNPTYFLRLQHYPGQPDIFPEDQFGIAPHTDYGFFTLLAQHEVTGLEVRYKDEWVKVPIIPGSFVLNSGDMLRRISNNKFKSTPHRVVNSSEKKRYSIPFFYDPDMHANISVLKNCVDSDEKIFYSSIMYGDYLMERIQGNYGLGKK